MFVCCVCVCVEEQFAKCIKWKHLFLFAVILQFSKHMQTDNHSHQWKRHKRMLHLRSLSLSQLMLKYCNLQELLQKCTKYTRMTNQHTKILNNNKKRMTTTLNKRAKCIFMFRRSQESV